MVIFFFFLIHLFFCFAFGLKKLLGKFFCWKFAGGCIIFTSRICSCWQNKSLYVLCVRGKKPYRDCEASTACTIRNSFCWDMRWSNLLTCPLAIAHVCKADVYRHKSHKSDTSVYTCLCINTYRSRLHTIYLHVVQFRGFFKSYSYKKNKKKTLNPGRLYPGVFILLVTIKWNAFRSRGSLMFKNTK